jgi:hypothetical protein
VASGVTGLFGIAFLVGYWLTAPVGTWSTTNDPSVPLSVSLLVLGIIAAVISVVCGFFAIVSPLKEARDVAEDKDMKTAEIKTQAGNVIRDMKTAEIKTQAGNVIRLAVIGKKVVLTLTKPGVGGVEVYNAFLDEAVLLRHCQGEEEAREI